MLHQVRHAGFAIAFMARAHQVRDIDRDLGLGLIGKQTEPAGRWARQYSVMPSTEVTFCWAWAEKVKRAAANTAKETFRRIVFLRNSMTWIIAGTGELSDVGLIAPQRADQASLKLAGKTLHHRDTARRSRKLFSDQLSAVSHQLLAVGVWLLALLAHGGRAKSSRPAKKRRISSTVRQSRKLSAVSFQPSAISSWLLAFGFWLCWLTAGARNRRGLQRNEELVVQCGRAASFQRSAFSHQPSALGCWRLAFGFAGPLRARQIVAACKETKN